MNLHKIMMMLLAAVGLAASLCAVDPIIGTWKLNIAKSRFPATEKMPKELISRNHFRVQCMRSQAAELFVYIRFSRKLSRRLAAWIGSTLAAYPSYPSRRHSHKSRALAAAWDSSDNAARFIRDVSRRRSND